MCVDLEERKSGDAAALCDGVLGLMRAEQWAVIGWLAGVDGVGSSGGGWCFTCMA